MKINSQMSFHQVLVELAELQDREVGDGTTSVVIIAAELLKVIDISDYSHKFVVLFVLEISSYPGKASLLWLHLSMSFTSHYVLLHGSLLIHQEGLMLLVFSLKHREQMTWLGSRFILLQLSVAIE